MKEERSEGIDSLQDSNWDVEKNETRSLSLIGATALIIGTMIGVGVFVTGSEILALVGSPGMSIIFWTVGAFVALCGGFSYTEWSLMLPQNGGDISYLNYAYKKPAQFFSFLYCWCRVLLIHPAYIASMSILAGDYLYRTFDDKEYKDLPSYNSVEMYKKGLGFLFLVCLFCLCAFSNVIATRASTIITFLKLIIIGFVILTVILALTVKFGEFKAPNTFSAPFKDTSSEANNYATALFQIFFAYDGWANLSMVIDELQNPSKNISRAIIASVTAVAIIYLSVNLSFFGVLTPAEMKALAKSESPTLAIVFATKAYDSAIMGKVMAVLIMISAFGAGLCMAFGTARVGQYAGQQKILPFSNFLAQTHPRFQTPFNALVVNCVIAAGLLIVPPGAFFFKLVSIAMFGVWLFYGITLTGLLIVRFREPDRPRPFKVFILCPIIVILTSIFLTIGPFFGKQWLYSLIGLVLFLSGIPVYYFTLYRRVKVDM